MSRSSRSIRILLEKQTGRWSLTACLHNHSHPDRIPVINFTNQVLCRLCQKRLFYSCNKFKSVSQLFSTVAIKWILKLNQFGSNSRLASFPSRCVRPKLSQFSSFVNGFGYFLLRDHFINSITSSIEFRKKWIDFWAHRKMSKFLMWRKILFLKFSPDFEETWNTEPWLSWLSLGGLALVSSEIPRPCWRHPSAQNMADFFEFALPASSPVFEPPIESVSRTLFTQNQWTLLKIEKATEVFRYLNDQTS